MNKSLLRYACATILFVWLVNSLASTFYWYSAMWWFDIPMHFLGGIFLALLAGALFFKKLVHLSLEEKLVTIMLFVLVIGLSWEFFEYIVQGIFKGVILANIPDSAKDMIMDIIGGLFASVFVLRALKRYNRAHAKVITGR